MKTIDARGLPCPQPVLLTHKALQEADEVTTIVDNLTATENLRRLASGKGCEVQVRAEKDVFHVTLHRIGQVTNHSQTETPLLPAEAGTKTKTVLLVTSDGIGQGSQELGQVLMRAFFHTVGEMEALPSVVIFMNNGVRLTVNGSPVLDDLKTLEARGVELCSCGTCLKYFELTDRLAVGHVSNMYEIAETLFGAGKIVRP